MTEKTPREILDAIDKALKETAVRVAASKPKRVPHPPQPDRPAAPARPKTPREILAKPKRVPHPPQPDRPAAPARPKTPREILDAIDKALAETARQFADRGH